MSTFLALVKSFLSLLILLFRYVFYRAISSFLTGLVLLFVAVLMFITFYQAYMPVVSHVKPVHLQFSSECQASSNALCSYPEASVFFTSPNKASEERMLMRGQSYKVFLDIDMPSSPTNEKLGMFMVNVKFLSAKGTVLKSSSRSCMLHYESSLVRLFRTVFYSLPLTLGITEEKQKVEINFFDDYIDDSYNPVVQAKVVIMSKQVEIYSSTLRLQASFTGLRYVIFNWPTLFTCLAVLGNFVTVTLIYSAFTNQFSSNPSTTSNNEEQTNQQQDTQQQTTQQPRSTILEQQNRTLENSAPSVSRATTSIGNAARMLSSAVDSQPSASVPVPVRRIATCTSCKARNHRVSGVRSVRLKIFKKQGKRRNLSSGKGKNVVVENKNLSNDESKETTNQCQSSLHHEITGRSEVNEISDCNIENTSSIDKRYTSYQSVGLKTAHVIDEARLREVEKHKSKPKHSKKQGKGESKTHKKAKACHFQRSNTKESPTIIDEKVEMNMASSKFDTECPAEIPPGWDSFCFSTKWETFKLPRIRRLGKYLQETMPSFTKRVRHCISDLELSTVEENRLVQTVNCTRRSASASDLTMIGSSAFSEANASAIK